MKDLNISNELLSNVLSIEIHSNLLSFDSIIFECSLPLEQKVSLYKFAFLCKEWALSNGYYLKSRGVNTLCKESMPKCEVEYIDKNNMFVSKDFYSNSEIEAIIKACTHILNNLSNK